ncbi:MAG: Omp28-related outer membrane protein [Saprospiraceae bacterium]|nr:T9SS type A sorting domain-containing protein [Bacteroidia bacterium]NNL92836.1 Omp28-related outer membrane protein [Saprospiraceae bacterium]
MKKILLLAILFGFINGYSQGSKTPVLAKVTATWCSKCGTWGWSFMEEMKSAYGQSMDAVILGVHYSGNLENPLGVWYRNNMSASGQPVFLLNNEDQNVFSSNWSARVETVKNKIIDIASEAPAQDFNFINAYVNDADEIVAQVNFRPHMAVDNDYYFGVYIFENNVEETQATRGTSLHPNVLRDIISDNFYGDLVFSAGDISPANNMTREYNKLINPSWNAQQVGLVGILWKKQGTVYEIENAAVIYNIGLLSSNNELIDEDLITVKNRFDNIEINLEDNENYNVSLVNNIGQIIDQKQFAVSTIIETSGLPSGIYTLHFSQDNKRLNKQIFIGR